MANPNMAMNRPSFPFKGMIESFKYGIFVGQKVDLLEVLSGCETANRYNVYEMNQQGQKVGHPMIKCKEESSYLAKQCLRGAIRPLQMQCTNMFNMNKICLVLDKPYKWTFYCFNRPEMSVYFTEDGGRVPIGKVVDNWDFMNFSFSLIDAKGVKRFHIQASCYQLGFHCKMPFESCQTIEFDVYRGDKQ